jgi:hypothetical protein
VFKLKKDVKKTHPMAFEFPVANPLQLFFPTVHIHDGKVHGKAKFDHALYAQFTLGLFEGFDLWTESAQPARMFLEVARSKDLVEGNMHAYRRMISGMRKNEDILA